MKMQRKIKEKLILFLQYKYNIFEMREIWLNIFIFKKKILNTNRMA